MTVPILTFLGATGTVTGSRFLIQSPTATVLVECGMYQGPKELRLRNWEAFTIPPRHIDAVVVTHGHVDHLGLLPRLGAHGFAGQVYATSGTAALAAIVLPDAGRLQEEEAEYAGARGYSKHRPPRPLFTEADAEAVLASFRAVDHGVSVDVAHGVSVRFRRAGHILGSAFVEVVVNGRTVTFSGDLGRPSHPLLLPPEPLGSSDVVVVESTYGDRVHGDDDGLDELAAAVNRSARLGGSVVVPSFAVDRTEVLLHHLARMTEAGRIPELPIYVDSPMALAALGVYRKAIGAGWPEFRPEIRRQGETVLDLPNLHEVRTVHDSERLTKSKYPAVIISASGMATGGRVLHHLSTRLPDPRCTVVLPGFQAEGTRGRQLLDGARQIKLLGRYVPVRAQVVGLPVFSVHADRRELLDWLASAPSPPETTYVVHGEPDASSSFRDAVVDKLGWCSAVPRYGERVRLD